MRILHLIYTHGISGAEKYLKYLLPGLKEHGIICDLMVVCPPPAADTLSGYCRELNESGIKTSLLIMPSRLSVVNTARKINAYLRAEQINIVHSHLSNSDFIAALLKMFFFRDLFLISTKHGYQEKVLEQYEPGKNRKPNNLYYYLTKFTLRKIDRNVAVSKGIADLYYNIKLTPVRYPFIHHGVKIDEFDRESYRAECRKADLQLIVVGRIEGFKGHRFLIRALRQVADIFPGVKLLVLGEGSEKNNCKELVRSLGLDKNVEFLGFRPHPYSYVSHSDVVILPSLFEPFGLVYIEAFALRTPVVAFDTPAGNEIMENNLTAFLVEKGNSDALAEKIIYLLKNPEERKKMTERAYEKYTSHFTTEVMVKNTASWYLSLGR